MALFVSARIADHKRERKRALSRCGAEADSGSDVYLSAGSMEGKKKLVDDMEGELSGKQI
jgi:hypothetical protein